MESEHLLLLRSAIYRGNIDLLVSLWNGADTETQKRITDSLSHIAEVNGLEYTHGMTLKDLAMQYDKQYIPEDKEEREALLKRAIDNDNLYWLELNDYPVSSTLFAYAVENGSLRAVETLYKNLASKYGDQYYLKALVRDKEDITEFLSTKPFRANRAALIVQHLAKMGDVYHLKQLGDLVIGNLNLLFKGAIAGGHLDLARTVEDNLSKATINQSLGKAIESGNQEAIDYVLSLGVTNFESGLSAAIISNKPEYLPLLLEAGASKELLKKLYFLAKAVGLNETTKQVVEELLQ